MQQNNMNREQDKIACQLEKVNTDLAFKLKLKETKLKETNEKVKDYNFVTLLRLY